MAAAVSPPSPCRSESTGAGCTRRPRDLRVAPGPRLPGRIRPCLLPSVGLARTSRRPAGHLVFARGLSRPRRARSAGADRWARRTAPTARMPRWSDRYVRVVATRAGSFAHPSPTLQGPRLSLLRHALRLGGIGALQRLRSTTGDIGTRLAAASRTDEQRLLQSWRSTMTDPATASVQPTWSIATAALFFTIALAALGLRSTKR